MSNPTVGDKNLNRYASTLKSVTLWLAPYDMWLERKTALNPEASNCLYIMCRTAIQLKQYYGTVSPCSFHLAQAQR